MCRTPGWSRIGAVDRQTVVIRLELQRADESLTGRASDGSGAAREFIGWMGLVAAIDALVRGAAPAPAAPDSSGTADEGAAS
jgi:hypothetical protein